MEASIAFDTGAGPCLHTNAGDTSAIVTNGTSRLEFQVMPPLDLPFVQRRLVAHERRQLG